LATYEGWAASGSSLLDPSGLNISMCIASI
jgi:hypothetical protein